MARPRKGLVPVWRDAVRDSDLDKTAKAVALTLSTWMNGRGVCYPARTTIAEGSSLCLRAAERAMRRLEVAGWVAVARTKGGKGRTNTYTALLPQTAQEIRRSEWQTAYERTANGVSESPNGVREDTGKRLKALESGGAYADRPLQGSAAPLEECPRCHEVKRLAGPDFIFCDGCLEERAEA